VGAFASRDARNVDALLGMRAQALASNQLDTWLEAVGNAATAKAFPAVEEHLASENTRIRSAALSALREMPGENVLDALQPGFRPEKNADLRRQAATILAGRPEDASLRFAGGVLESEADDELRIATLRGLAPRMEERPVRELVERTIATDRSRRV